MTSVCASLRDARQGKSELSIDSGEWRNLQNLSETVRDHKEACWVDNRRARRAAAVYSVFEAACPPTKAADRPWKGAGSGLGEKCIVYSSTLNPQNINQPKID